MQNKKKWKKHKNENRRKLFEVMSYKKNEKIEMRSFLNYDHDLKLAIDFVKSATNGILQKKMCHSGIKQLHLPAKYDT